MSKKQTDKKPTKGAASALIDSVTKASTAFCEKYESKKPCMFFIGAATTSMKDESETPSLSFTHGPSDDVGVMIAMTLSTMLKDKNLEGLTATAILQTVSEHPKLLSAIERALPTMKMLGVMTDLVERMKK